MTISFITGAAGFIGSNLVDHLLNLGDKVVGYDNFSTGQHEFLMEAKKNPRFRLIEGDLLDEKSLTEAMHGCGRVFHLSANADVRFGLNHPRKDLEQNIIGTYNVLEAMRAHGIRDICFSSTGSVYGEASQIPTPEDAPMPVQTSLYASSKLSGEGLLSSYAEGFHFRARIFRFVSILGARYTHGHIFDFYKQLRDNPKVLNVLGNGLQRKSYLAVDDCIAAMMTVYQAAPAVPQDKGFTQIFNLGTAEYCQVNDSIGWICGKLGLNPELRYSGGERGWVGDNPFIFLETKKIRSLGWSPRWCIREGVEQTVEWLHNNPWIFNRR